MGSSSLKDYLKRYESNTEEEKKKKKKKQKKKSQPQTTGLLVVDEDPMWQKPVDLGEENNDNSSDEEKPLVDEDIDVKRMKRLEQLRARRPYHAISEDGSGWVSLSSKPDDFIDSNIDMSPPRKRKSADLSPGQQLRRNDTPSPDYRTSDLQDISPPRRRRHDSPPQDFSRGSVASDISPPRKNLNNAARTGLPDVSGIRSPEDFSPSQRDRHGYETSDLQDISPPRRSRHDSPSQDVLRGSVAPDLSPPRRIQKNVARSGFSDSRHHSPQDLSPPRRGRHDSPSQDALHGSVVSDLSPPRKVQKNVGRLGSSSISVKVGSHPSLDPDLSPPRKNTKDSSKPASKTGLISGKDISDEIEKKKRDDMLRFNQMDPSISGRGAEPVYRDKIKGVRISKEEYLKSKQKVEEKPKEIEIEWGKGLAQKREAEARLKELELEKEKPFARTRDDPELDKMFKERLRWGDPMAHLVKKKYPEPVLPNLGENEKMKESGFVVPQDIPNHSWLKRGLDAAPNRYGIRPGRHWDGVDRSNGFEKDMFKRTNERQARDREAYLWSVSDM
ncbi:BUD13 homolog [Vigna radiata var. radiata]|uniref:BUD13 homolog n=1 Tax=Vigna radiata var. radiata TaxID=3916 RepID=A0A1S3VEA2_VIGRR|nr:BUD13 homolog [Vigna radiata var. radiata]XP_014516694.1 BUD13 homolog [Vigna radiata var. radiata]XP_014516695.1 BUD13 homolog [Vigna radiata var. radiata]XP_022641666.1 BUD13 homolog [Vigna radiata var. radiata]